MDQLIMISLPKQKLAEAYFGCVSMAETFPEMLKKINLNGTGEKQAAKCKEYLMTAANACMALVNMKDQEAEKG